VLQRRRSWHTIKIVYDARLRECHIFQKGKKIRHVEGKILRWKERVVIELKGGGDFQGLTGGLKKGRCAGKVRSPG